MSFEEDFENGFDERLVMSTKGELDVEEKRPAPQDDGGLRRTEQGQGKPERVHFLRKKCAGKRSITSCCTGPPGLGKTTLAQHHRQ